MSRKKHARRAKTSGNPVQTDLADIPGFSDWVKADLADVKGFKDWLQANPEEAKDLWQHLHDTDPEFAALQVQMVGITMQVMERARQEWKRRQGESESRE